MNDNSSLQFGRPVGRLVVFFLLILLFSSCSKKDIRDNSSYVINSCDKNIPNYILLNEAKYSDIPVPIGFRPVHYSINKHYSFNKKSDLLIYKGDLDLFSVLDFYHKTLEREGWQIEDLSNDCEGLLFCSKPTKKCIISFRKFRKNSTKIYLFIKKRLEELDVVGDINSKDVTKLKMDFWQDLSD